MTVCARRMEQCCTAMPVDVNFHTAVARGCRGAPVANALRFCAGLGAKMMMGLVRLFLALLLLAPAAGAQEVKLKASLQLSITHLLVGVSITRLKEEVERRSDKTLI